MPRVRAASILWMGTLFCHTAHAVDGVIEINQAKAAAGGINGSLASDPPGFPVVISQPGSYRLTGPLSAPEFLRAIVITADGVTLDLNGFAIGTQLPAAGVDGIDAAGRAGIRVRDGTIEGFGGEGVDAGERARIENVTVSDSGGVGIRVSHLSTVLRSNVRSSGSHGIEAGEVCTLADNIAETNGFAGVFAPSRSTLTGNVVNANGGPGIEAGYASTIRGNVASFNTGNGIRAGEGSTVRDNSVRNNGGDGIRADSGCTIGQNAVMANGGDGIEVGHSSAVLGNSVSGNGRCGLHSTASCGLTCAFSGWAHNVLSSNNGGVNNRQVHAAGLVSMASSGSGDLDETNVCSGSAVLANRCTAGAANSCP